MNITSDLQHGFICVCSFHTWFPDMQGVLLMEMMQQVNKRKDGRGRKFKEKA